MKLHVRSTSPSDRRYSENS